jgi:superfamily I DNA/RNA helicase
MTIHQAKGLEFKYVFIVGLEEGNYPCDRNIDVEELEEERRIFYVALTRAKINCFLSYAEERKLVKKQKREE